MTGTDRELAAEKVQVTLAGPQIFCLFAGGAVIASLVFVLGVMVGRRVEARSQSSAAPTGQVLDPLAALDELEPDSSEERLLYPNALRATGDDGESVAPLAPIDEALGPAGDRALDPAGDEGAGEKADAGVGD